MPTRVSISRLRRSAVTALPYHAGMPHRRLLQVPRLLDLERGAWLDDRRLLVDPSGRIEAILGADDSTPTDAAPHDIGEGWVIPGLIDCHTHLAGEIQSAAATGTTNSEAQEALLGVLHARLTLAAGFTSVRDVGAFRAFTDVALRDAIDAGWTPGPRMQCAGAMITCPGGGGDVTGLARDIILPEALRFGVVRSPADMRERVKALIGGGATVIKLIVTGAVLTPGTRPSVIELEGPMVEAAVQTAEQQGVHVAAHAHGTEGIKVAIRAGARSIEHGSLIDDEGIALLVEHGTWLVADIYDGDWIAEEGARAGWPAETMAKNEATTRAQREGFRKAVAAGVRIAFGTDSGVYPHGRNAIQFGYHVRYGQSPLEAIRSATTSAAALLDWEEHVGSLAPGRFADLVVVPSDPLADIEVLRHPSSVWKGGVRISG
jgi:imidazolonepropionase-like amidohydrolase